MAPMPSAPTQEQLEAGQRQYPVLVTSSPGMAMGVKSLSTEQTAPVSPSDGTEGKRQVPVQEPGISNTRRRTTMEAALPPLPGAQTVLESPVQQPTSYGAAKPGRGRSPKVAQEI